MRLDTNHKYPGLMWPKKKTSCLTSFSPQLFITLEISFGVELRSWPSFQFEQSRWHPAQTRPRAKPGPGWAGGSWCHSTAGRPRPWTAKGQPFWIPRLLWRKKCWEYTVPHIPHKFGKNMGMDRDLFYAICLGHERMNNDEHPINPEPSPYEKVMPQMTWANPRHITGQQVVQLIKGCSGCR